MNLNYRSCRTSIPRKRRGKHTHTHTGKVLGRVVNLRDETSIFLKEQKHELVDRFSEVIRIAKLLSLADFFTHVNQLNGCTQGKQRTFSDIAESIDAFKDKIKLWLHGMETGKLAATTALNLLMEEKILICVVFVQSFLSTSLHLFPN